MSGRSGHDAATEPPLPPLPPRRRGRRLGLALLGLLLAALLAFALVLAALLRSEGGSAWLLGRLPGVQVQGVRGALARGPFEVAQLQLAVGGRTVRIDGLGWQDLHWQWRPHPGAWAGIAVDSPTARRVEIGPAPPDTPPAAPSQPLTPPASLRLPVELELRGLRVDVLQFEDQVPVTDLRASLHLGADGGARHRLSALSLRRDGLQAQGEASIAADAPFELQAEARVGALPGGSEAWTARLAAHGPLARLAAEARFDDPRRHAQLQAEAELTPFAAWPLGTLQLRTQDLDLAALASGAPSTKISGTAVVRSSGMDSPLSAELRLHNAEPGRLDLSRLPLRSLALDLKGLPSDRRRLSIESFIAEFADAQGSAGRVEGRGQWVGGHAELNTQWSGLRPSRLDARAAAMTLAGPLELSIDGLPAPDGSTPAAPTLAAHVQTTLEGRLDAAPDTPVRLRLAGQAERSPQGLSVEVQEAVLAAGSARAAFSAAGGLKDGGAWRATSRGTLEDFDPRPWLPGAPDAPWRRGPHRLNARWQLDLRGALPASTAAPAARRAAPSPLASVRGEASVDIVDSLLAGVPLSGRVRASGADALQLEAELQAASNRLRVQGQLARQGSEDRWEAVIEAPALADLNPVLALVPGLPSLLPASGSVNADLAFEGRWPTLRSRGQARVRSLQLGDLRAAQADARWNVATDASGALALSLDAQGLARGEQRIEQLHARLDGSARDHRFELQASSPLRPPEWVDAVVGNALAAAAAGSAASASTGAGTRGTDAAGAAPGSTLALRAEGSWQPADLQWRGRILELSAQPRRGGTAWASARNLEGSVRFGPEGGLAEAALAPGRIELLGASLRWTKAHWAQAPASAAAGNARLDLDAELEPLRVAPLLARLQPQFGWGGDLAIGGRFVVSSGASFAADVVLERRSGDLLRRDEAGVQALGLTDLRLSLQANQGVWYFTQALAGSNVGVLAGAQALRVAPSLSWPPPDAPLEGVLEWRVSDIGVWAPFTPAGWRLGGQLRVSASLGGTFGAPEYTGRIVGSQLAVRNLLEGIDVRDGELAVTLRGADARIDRFVFHGGDGELRLSGGASFGADPRAQLRVVAQHFRLLGRIDRRIVVSGQAELALAAETLKLDGRFTVDEGLIDFSRADAPTLDDDVTVIGRGNGDAREAAPPGAPPPNPLLRNAEVMLQVDLGDELWLRGRGIETRLAGQLRITTPGGRLAVNGTVRTVSGNYAAYGQKLDIERGVVTFVGPVDNPRLDILAVRPNLDVRVGVLIGGSAQSPRIRLYSEPEMSDMDKLSWLVVGRAPEGLGRADTALLQRAALALLAGEGGGASDTLLKNIGLDDFSVRQEESGDVRETVVSVGKQLSRRWYVGYERGVNATSGTWQLIYRIAQRFTLRLQSGTEEAFDVIWTWRWD